MMKSHGRISVTTAVLLFAVVTACGPNSESDAEPTSAPTVIDSGDSPDLNTPESKASAAAVTAVTAYYEVVDKVRHDPSAPVTDLDLVAISTQLSAQQQLLASQRADGLHQEGSTRVVATTVQSVSLENSNPSGGHVPAVMIDVCWDVSHVDVLDQAGKSVVAPDRADRGWTRLTVANYSWDTDPDDGWRVAGGEDLEKSPCTG